MRILGIETSCDETAAAIVENGTKVLSSVIASSEEIHKKYGGIIPEKAAREQLKSIIPIITLAIKQYSNIAIRDIDAIAVTVGPGLIGSLLVGVETAKTLAWAWDKPIIPVNHLIAHIYANFINNNIAIFPSLCLIVSGGHTELVLMKGHSQFKWLGGTRDDAAGECFDKCSRLLHLGYPGGPAIEKAASEVKSSKLKVQSLFKLPRPMISEDNFDFSFSGLKTAALHTLKKLKKNNLTGSCCDRNTVRLTKEELAYEIQEAITDVLVKKTLKAAQKYQVKSILVGGGVAANKRLREKFNQAIQQFNNSTMKLFIPNKNLCTDNAAVIASAAYFNYHPIPWLKIKANPSLSII